VRRGLTPPISPETFHLPDDERVRVRFGEKVLRYREATILLTLVDRVKLAKGVTSGDPLFEPVLEEFERIIYPVSDESSARTRLECVTAALEDLADRMNLDNPVLGGVPVEDRKVAAGFRWSRKWFADIGHEETNPATLVKFFVSWSDLRSSLEKGLDALVV
jgi:hypothetical protein